MTALTLGPVLFNWPVEQWRDFYFRIADEADVDSVYLGEVVCSKRTPFFEPQVAAVVERLDAAGKEVVHSTLALIMNDREMRQIRELAAAPDLYVEANDVSAISLLAGRRHAVGPYVNVYNEGTLGYLARNGADRICLPPELSAQSIAALAKAAPKGLALEVQVFGRLPLAISARCYHARSRDLAKDNCQYACADDADGMDLETLDGDLFLAVNGTQTLSYSFVNLAAELPSLQKIGVSRFRLSPHTSDMVAVAGVFRQVMQGKIDVAEADDRLADLVGDVPFANGYYHGAEGQSFLASGE